MLQADTSDVPPPSGWFCHMYDIANVSNFCVDINTMTAEFEI